MLADFTTEIAGAVLLVAGHLGLSSALVRPKLIARLGINGFRLLYSVVSLAALALLIAGYVISPYELLWEPPAFAFWVPVLVMPAALLLILCGYLRPNPTALAMEAAMARPDAAAGIFAVTRHPVQWGVFLAAFAHIPANGDVAALILFGSFALLALAGSLHQDARNRAAGGPHWARFEAQTSWLPFHGIVTRKTHLALREIGLVGPGAAAVLYLALLLLHERLIGAAAIPG